MALAPKQHGVMQLTMSTEASNVMVSPKGAGAFRGAPPSPAWFAAATAKSRCSRTMLTFEPSSNHVGDTAHLDKRGSAWSTRHRSYCLLRSPDKPGLEPVETEDLEAAGEAR
jgi:hypothetical protein